MSNYRPLKLIISGAAVVLGLGHLLFPQIEIDAVLFGLMVLAVLPWLAPLVKSVELPGIGKVELQDLQQKVEEVRGATESANRKADLALSRAKEQLSPIRHSTATIPGSPREQLEELVSEYERICDQRPSSVRTEAMIEIVGRIMVLVRRLDDFDAIRYLESRSPGSRLAAYVYLYIDPQADLLTPLVVRVTEMELIPFNQYWGLQAILRVIASAEVHSFSIPSHVKADLQRFSAIVPRGTDRAYELQKILDRFDPQAEEGDMPKDLGFGV